jgi:hypothetical protein
MTLRVRTLWLFGLTLALGSAASAGCGGDGGDAQIAITWRVAYVGPELTDCDAAGTPTVRLEARRGSSTTTQPYSFEFPCASLKGVTEGLPTGNYDITLSLLDLKNRPVASTTGNFDVRRHGTNELNPVQFQVQAFQVSWLLVVKGPGNAMMTAPCAQLGVKTIEFSAKLSSDPAPEILRFDCLENPGAGLTSAIRTGNYAYQFRLLDATDKPLTESDLKPLVVGGSQLAIVPSETFTFM